MGFSTAEPGPTGKAVSVTPSDGSDLSHVPTRGLYVGTAGNLRVAMESGDVVTFVGVTGGSILPLKVARVYSTSTTASDIVALY